MLDSFIYYKTVDNINDNELLAENITNIKIRWKKQL